MHTTDKSPAGGSSRRLLEATVGCLALLAAAWSSPVMASVGCDKVIHDLQSLDIDTLVIEVVDLSDASKSPGQSGELTDSLAPLLFLTPRVATILEDVFGDSGEAEAVDERQPAGTKEVEPATSPVADNANAPDMGAAGSPMYENAAILPRFQRQMYRTDI